MHGSTRGVVLAGVAALLSAGLLVYVGVTTARGRRAMSGGALATPAVPEPPSVEPIDKNPSLMSAQPDVVGRAVVVGALTDGLVRANRAVSLGEATRAVVRMYEDGTVEGFEQWLVSNGLAPPPGWEERRDTFHDEIELGFETLRDAPIDTDHVAVRTFSLRVNHDTEGDDASATVTEAQRPDRAPGPESADSLTAIEVVMPIQIRAHQYSISSGSASLSGPALADVRLGLVMVWDQTREAWILVKTRIYDLPPGAVAVMPPL